jgi:ribosomal protein S13
MLLRVRKILEGGDLTGFAPAPANGERQAVGLSILAGKGIGPAKARAILGKFWIELAPATAENYLTDCDGIGRKLAMSIASQIHIGGDHAVRPKKQKAEVPK